MINCIELPVQIELLTKQANSLGIDEISLFREVASAKDTKHRPVLNDMLEQIDAGYFTHVLVYKLDRISCSVMDFSLIYERLKKKMSSLFP